MLARYILAKLQWLTLILVGISILVFLLIRLVPGDVISIMLYQQASAEKIQEIRGLFGLDQPLHVQYLRWVTRALRGDLGRSIVTGRPVLADIVERFPVTLELSFLAALIALVLAIPFGIISAARPGSVADGIGNVISVLGLGLPNFWLATILVLAFSVKLALVPPIGYVSPLDNPVQNLRLMLLPALSLSTYMTATVMRMTRSAFIEILGQDFVRAARAKGLSESVVLLKHALRNALIAILTMSGIEVAKLLGGSLIIEQIFALPGMGRYAVEAIFARDYPIVQGTVLVVALTFVLINLTVDLLYAAVDPRVRY